MSEKLSIVICEVGKEIREGTVEDKLESLQNLVGGNIEFFDLDDEISIICNEEGKINGLELNRVIRDEDNQIIEAIAGDFFIVGNDYKTGNLKSLTPEQIEKMTEKFKYPERIYCINGTVFADKYVPKNKEVSRFSR